MTQNEHIRAAIEHLDKAIDTFPDKDDIIRRYNAVLDGIINQLHLMIGETEI